MRLRQISRNCSGRVIGQDEEDEITRTRSVSQWSAEKGAGIKVKVSV